jgi:dTDP-4-dehydrorhamnose reductase
VSQAILLTGGTGQLGRELLRLDWPDGVTLDAPGREALDLADADALAARVREGRHAAVINAGAYTAVDAAENDALAAWRVNALAPAALATACAERGIPIVQLSTDYVFGAGEGGPWSPDEALRPLSAYGASKAGGELAVRASGARYANLRTAWVVSAHGRNFVKTMLRLAQDRDELGVVADQVGSPTAAADLAVAVQAVVLRLLRDPAMNAGTWHTVNAEFASWHELAAHVFAQAGRRGHKVPRLNAIGTSDYPTPAARPADSRLDTQTFARDFGIVLPSWRDGVTRIVAELLEGNRS